MPNHITNQIEFFGKREDIDKVFELIKGEVEYIDFNNIIHMPASLNLPSGSDTDGSMQYALSLMEVTEATRIKNILRGKVVKFYGNYLNKVFMYPWDSNMLQEAANRFETREPNPFDETDYEKFGIKTYEDLGNTYIKNIIAYNHDTWHEWCCANWGTKWNAYDTELDDDILTFDTAWSCPIPVLDALAKICYNHNVSFSGKWADEDTGHNVGVFESNCNGDEYSFNYREVEDESNEAYEIYIEVKGHSGCFGKDEDGNWRCYDCENCPNPC